MIAGPIFCSKMSRAARSGTLSPNGFQFACERPEPVKPTRSYRTGKRRRPRNPSYCGGSHTASLRADGSPSGLSLRISELCSTTTSVPAAPLGRFSAMDRNRTSEKRDDRRCKGVVAVAGHHVCRVLDVHILAMRSKAQKIAHAFLGEQIRQTAAHQQRRNGQPARTLFQALAPFIDVHSPRPDLRIPVPTIFAICRKANILGESAQIL